MTHGSISAEMTSGGGAAQRSRWNNTLNKTKLGQSGPEVFPLGLGCMGMSGVYLVKAVATARPTS
jgi:hypothetical protein